MPSESVSLVDAIDAKYGPDQVLTEVECSILSFRSSGDLPGKRGASGALELLVLNGENIATCGSVDRLTELCSNITELDLAKNLLSDWHEIAAILSCMPLISHCNLSQNPLSELPLSFALSDHLINQPFLNLSSLVLNATGVSWEAVFWMLDVMSQTEGMETKPPRAYTTVHVLHLNCCQIRSWESLMKMLQPFPLLETLVATGNPIQRITITQDEALNSLGCLQCLNINQWPINRWEDIDRLRYLPLLCELRALGLPLLTELTDDERRQLLIARLPEISTLNGSPITPKQREDAERFFVRFYLETEDKPARALELESIHGQLGPLADVSLAPPDEVEVVLVSDVRRETRTIPLKQTVAKFKKGLEDFIGLPVSNFRVFHKGGTPFMEELKLPRLMLHNLKLRTGDEFYVQEKPVLPKRARNTSASSSYQFLRSTMEPQQADKPS